VVTAYNDDEQPGKPLRHHQRTPRHAWLENDNKESECCLFKTCAAVMTFILFVNHHANLQVKLELFQQGFFLGIQFIDPKRWAKTKKTSLTLKRFWSFFYRSLYPWFVILHYGLLQRSVLVQWQKN